MIKMQIVAGNSMRKLKVPQQLGEPVKKFIKIKKTLLLQKKKFISQIDKVSQRKLQYFFMFFLSSWNLYDFLFKFVVALTGTTMGYKV